MRYPFFTDAALILNSGQSRSIVLCGNVHDLFFAPDPSSKGGQVPDGKPAAQTGGSYQPLGRVLAAHWEVPGILVLVYELNGPVRYPSEEARKKVKSAWMGWKSGLSADDLAIQGMLDSKLAQERESLDTEFERLSNNLVGNPTVALEFLRQLCLCSRSTMRNGAKALSENLLILVEAADLLLPDGDIARMSRPDRHRVAILFDWFSDPEFQNADDSVVLIAESKSLLHHRVARLPYLLSVDVPSPHDAARAHYLEWFQEDQTGEKQLELWSTDQDFVAATAGLSLQAIRQLLLGSLYSSEALSPAEVSAKVAEFIERELGEDVVEFKRPGHGLDAVIGFTQLKEFLRTELIPRFKTTGADALTGAAVGGPVGGGKSFLFEAVAQELDFPVIILKNLRSQWFGQTDVIFERLRRALMALGKVMIFIDEADTQFGGVGAESHSTERRLTGKIQAMMSDPALRGRVVWLLMTARIHLLSPDLRRPGRAGDLIIPVLDPVGEDRRDFLRWTMSKVLEGELDEAQLDELDAATGGFSAAAYASLRSNLAAAATRGKLDAAGVQAVIADYLPPAIESTRRYQTLQALLNCTRRSLLPESDTPAEERRENWRVEIAQLEAQGVR